MRWVMVNNLWTKRGFIVPAIVAGLLLVSVACGGTAAEPVVVEKEVIKEVLKEVVVEKEVIKEVPIEVVVVKEVEVIKEVIKEVPVPAPQAVTPAEVPKPNNGGILALAQTADPPTFDPHATSFSLLTNHVHLTHNRVIRFKSLAWPENAQYGDLTFFPDLAESWEIDDSGTVFTFKLREGVPWHNQEPINGRELTSEDVKLSWKRMNEDSSRFSGFYDGLVSIETPDKYTVVQTIDRPLASWLYRVADGEAAWITNQDFVDSKGADFGVAQDSLVGTGPFLYGKEEPGSRYTYLRNPDYFEQPYPYLDEIQWYVIPDRSARDAAFVSRQIHYYQPTKAQDFERIQKALPDVSKRQTTGLANTTSALMFNMELPKWQDVRVRQAVKYAVNNDRVIQDLYNGQGKYNGCIPTALRGFSLEQDELRELYQYDPEKSKALLAEAGFAPGEFKLEIMTFTGYNQDNQDIAVMRQADLRAAGFDVTLNPVPVGEGRATVIQGNFDTVQQPHSTGVEPDEMLGGFVPDGPRNFMKVDDPKVTQWMAQQEMEFDREARGAILQEFSRYCADQVLGMIPNPARAQEQLWQSWVRNAVIPDIASDEPDEKYIWFDR
jgi:peptide/nickel transport system substrate-binding protein